MKNHEHADKQEHPFWYPVVHFLVHGVLGSLIFAIIAGLAWALGLLVHWFQLNGASPYALTVMTILENAIITVDAVVFFVYLCVTAFKAIKELS